MYQHKVLIFLYIWLACFQNITLNNNEVSEQIKITEKIDVQKQKVHDKDLEKKIKEKEEVLIEKTDDIKPKKSKKIFLIIGFLLIISAAGYLYINNSAENNVENEIQDSTTITIKDQETQVQPIEGEDVTKLGDFVDFTLPSDEIITIPENGIEKALLDLLLDKSKPLDESSYWLSFDRIHFDARETKYKVDSDEQIKNLSLILSSFPKVEIVIGSYTDNLGNPKSNIELSKNRSESIKNGLITLGISENRISTEGFGDGFPIAENNTPENQKLNRRISIKILKK